MAFQHSQAVQKVWDVSELVTNLLALLDPLSVLQLVESGVIDKEGLKKSLSLKAWNQIIKRSAYGDWWGGAAGEKEGGRHDPGLHCDSS